MKCASSKRFEASPCISRSTAGDCWDSEFELETGAADLGGLMVSGGSEKHSVPGLSPEPA